MLADFETVILDMNATFMFGHDRFSDAERYGAFYRRIGGSLPEKDATRIVTRVFKYLAQRYPNPAFRECFPSVRAALDAVVPDGLATEKDIDLLVDTFAHHERGFVPPEFALVVLKLASAHKLGLVADVWAPKDSWLAEFRRAGIASTFQAMSFSSDHGHCQTITGTVQTRASGVGG